MAGAKVVRGVVSGVTVTTTEENAERLGTAFQAEKKAPAKKAAASSKTSSK